MLWHHSKVLDLEDARAPIGHEALGKDFVGVVRTSSLNEHPHVPAIEIALDHIGLLVRQKKQRQVPSPITRHLANLHLPPPNKEKGAGPHFSNANVRET